MLDKYIEERLRYRDFPCFIDGFTPEEYLRFLEVYKRRYAKEGLDGDMFREDMRLIINYCDLPEDITSLPSPLPELIQGYERLTELTTRGFIGLEILPCIEADEIKFMVEIMVPEDPVDRNDPEYEPCSFISLKMKIEWEGWVVPNLPPNAVNSDSVIELSSSDALKLLNILAYEEVPIENCATNEKIHFTPSVQRAKSVGVGR